MLRGFKDFIMRGNVVDLAVGIVIGAAFTALVTSFTDSFLQPVIRRVNGVGVNGGKISIGGHQSLDWAGFVNSAITFVLTAATLYFLVVYPMNRLAERRRRGQEPPPAAPSEEIRLLTDIRDALLAGQAPPRPRPTAEQRDPIQPA